LLRDLYTVALKQEPSFGIQNKYYTPGTFVKKLSLILLLSFATSPLIAMGDGGEDAPAQAAGLTGSQKALYLTAIYNNNEQLLNNLSVMQPNGPLANLCMTNRQMLLMLLGDNNTIIAAEALPRNLHFAQEINLWRAQQALERAEQEDAPKRINAVLRQAEEQLKEQLVTTKQSGHDMMGYVTVALEGKELEDAVDKYVAKMNSVESSLMGIVGDGYISQPQSARALELLDQARRQTLDAKRALPLSWAGLNAQWQNQ
jgi:hypothetical protein